MSAIAVCALRLTNALGHLRPPALAQLLERADVEVAVVELGLEPRHVARHEAPVLADRIAAHRRLAGRHQRRQEIEQGLLGARLGPGRHQDAIDQSRNDRASRGSTGPSRRAPRPAGESRSPRSARRGSSESSVTMIATSMIRSTHGLSPVISMSTHTSNDSSGLRGAPDPIPLTGPESGDTVCCDIIFFSVAEFSHSDHLDSPRLLRCCSRSALLVSIAVRLWLAIAPGPARLASSRRGAGGVLGTHHAAAHRRAADYTVARVRLGMVEVLVGALLLLGLTLLRRAAVAAGSIGPVAARSTVLAPDRIRDRRGTDRLRWSTCRSSGTGSSGSSSASGSTA